VEVVSLDFVVSAVVDDFVEESVVLPLEVADIP
jgi:hypothetical protein